MEKMLQNMAEMDPDERRKLRKLLKENSPDSSKEKNLDWMYKQSTTDAEEYLLGKRIDKITGGTGDQTATPQETPGALFDEAISRRAGIDMLAKMREDPLFAIRKREEEARRRLLENPIKMKQLEKMVEKKDRNKKSKKKKKEKKRKTHCRSGSSDEDDELMRKYLSIVQKKSKRKDGKPLMRRITPDSDSDHCSRKDKSKITTGSCDSSEDEMGFEQKDRKLSETRHSKGRLTSCEDLARVCKHQSDAERGERQGSDRGDQDRPHRQKSQYPPPSSSTHHQYPQSSGYGLQQHSRSTEKRLRSRSRSPVKNAGRCNYKQETRVQLESNPTKKKLSEVEKERCRQEMMDNARWRDEQREANVKKYKNEDKKEKKLLEKIQEKKSGSDFVRPMMMSHAATSSVEDRIKRNIYKIQRTPADMEKSFKR